MYLTFFGSDSDVIIGLDKCFLSVDCYGTPRCIVTNINMKNDTQHKY